MEEGKKPRMFSLQWFAQTAERAVENTISKRLDKLIEQQDEEALLEETNIPTVKPYKNIKLINDVLVIVTNSGDVLSKTGATNNDFLLVTQCITEEEIMAVISSPEVVAERKEQEKEVKKMEALVQGIEVLKDLDDFDVREDAVYLKGIERSMPQLLVEKFIEVIHSINKSTEDVIPNYNSYVDYSSLKKFWLKCVMNPNAQSSEDLYKFLAKHKFKIDRHGNFYAYRRVRSLSNSNKELVEFVSNAYTKVKAVWKRKTSNYGVWLNAVDKSYKFVKTDVNMDEENPWTFVGNLEELYKDLPNYQSNSYTSAHTGQEDYRIGSVISMPRDEGDDNNNVSCSTGFHAASKAYDYTSFGDTDILVIISPQDVLSVPKGEDGKLRTCRWFFATTLSYEERYILDSDTYDVSDLGDVFEEACAENLTEYVQNAFAEEVTRHTFNVPELSAKQLKVIVKTLSQMKDTLDKRVVSL